MEERVDGKSEISVLVSYIDLIKAPDIYILELIKTKWRKRFTNIVDLKILDTLSHETLLQLWANRIIPNILEWIHANDEFYDFDKTYKNICKNLKFLYRDSEVLRLDQVIRNYDLNDGFKEIYLWSPEYDQRIYDDINERYKDCKKIQYITGTNLGKVIDATKVDLVYVAHIEDVKDLVPDEKYKSVFFAVAAYGINYSCDINNDEAFGKFKFELYKYKNIGEFPVLTLTENAFYNG